MGAILGSFSFLTMQPRPQGAQAGIVLESRAGSAGHAAWKTGTRGEPHSVKTLVAVADFATAAALVATYEAAVGSVVAASHGGVSCGNVLITHVSATPEAIVLGVSGAGQYRAMVRANWNLVAWV